MHVDEEDRNNHRGDWFGTEDNDTNYFGQGPRSNYYLCSTIPLKGFLQPRVLFASSPRYHGGQVGCTFLTL